MMIDEHELEKMGQVYLSMLDGHLRRAQFSIQESFGVLQLHMMDIESCDAEGEVTALGDNGVAELMCEIENRINLAITKARHNVHGEPG